MGGGSLPLFGTSEFWTMLFTALAGPAIALALLWAGWRMDKRNRELQRDLALRLGGSLFDKGWKPVLAAAAADFEHAGSFCVEGKRKGKTWRLVVSRAGGMMRTELFARMAEGALPFHARRRSYGEPLYEPERSYQAARLSDPDLDRVLVFCAADSDKGEELSDRPALREVLRQAAEDPAFVQLRCVRGWLRWTRLAMEKDILLLLAPNELAKAVAAIETFRDAL